MHKFKQFVDNCLEEAPVSPQEARILADHVHDVGGNDCLVVFATLLFTQAQQILDYCHEESLLIVLVHSSRYGADSPAKLKSSTDNILTCFSIHF